MERFGFLILNLPQDPPVLRLCTLRIPHGSSWEEQGRARALGKLWDFSQLRDAEAAASHPHSNRCFPGETRFSREKNSPLQPGNNSGGRWDLGPARGSFGVSVGGVRRELGEFEDTRMSPRKLPQLLPIAASIPWEWELRGARTVGCPPCSRGMDPDSPTALRVPGTAPVTQTPPERPQIPPPPGCALGKVNSATPAFLALPPRTGDPGAAQGSLGSFWGC